jgi:hydroxymethylbilane synthase
MTKRHLVIATRESPLALQQAEWVQKRLQLFHPHLHIELLGMTTKADQLLDTSLSQIGGKGLFVKELEEALLDGRADIAVHSMKDVPMELPPGLVIPVICAREEPRDVFVSNHFRSYVELPQNAVVGTSSLRRQTQLKHLRSDIVVKPLRGNINTRLSRLDEGNFDAIILAAAGLLRMGFSRRIRNYFSIEQMLPSAGQGALGIECREKDDGVLSIIKSLDHPITHACVEAERAVCRRLGGGCQAPVAAYAEHHRGHITLQGLVASMDGRRILRAKLTGDEDHTESMGKRVAEELIQQGAEKILKEFHGH